MVGARQPSFPDSIPEAGKILRLPDKVACIVGKLRASQIHSKASPVNRK
jgi:hypothetical protein